MIDNQEVAAELRRIAQALEEHLAWLRQRDDAALAFQAAEIDRQADALHARARPSSQVRRMTDAEHDAMLAGQGTPVGPRAGTGWPTPATVEQGFLSARWQRRDGDVYGTTGLAGPNSAIRGGDDANAAVDVPSGAPRSPQHP